MGQAVLVIASGINAYNQQACISELLQCRCALRPSWDWSQADNPNSDLQPVLCISKLQSSQSIQ